MTVLGFEALIRTFSIFSPGIRTDLGLPFGLIFNADAVFLNFDTHCLVVFRQLTGP